MKVGEHSPTVAVNLAIEESSNLAFSNTPASPSLLQNHCNYYENEMRSMKITMNLGIF